MRRFVIIFHSTTVPDARTLKSALECGQQDLEILRPGCFMLKSEQSAVEIAEKAISSIGDGKISVFNFEGDWFSNLRDTRLVAWMQTDGSV